MKRYPNVCCAHARPALIAATALARLSSGIQFARVSLPEWMSRAPMLQSPPSTHLLATSVIVHPLTLIVSRTLSIFVGLFGFENSSMRFQFDNSDIGVTKVAKGYV